jgi:carboxypeptidase Q
MRFWILNLLMVFSLGLTAQEAAPNSDEDAFFIKSIHDAALTKSSSYDWLMYLTKEIGGRLAGSPEAAAAVEYTRQMLDTLGLDTVYLQPCMVPRWLRGEPEVVRVASSAMGSFDLNALALGNSVGTGKEGISAPIIEVRSLDEVEALSEEEVKGKIVFYNRPMDPTQLNTFSAYGGAVDQRVFGASRAAKKGAIGVLVRSMTTRIDDFPHTGSMAYEDPDQKIPAVAVSTRDAETLHRLLRQGEVRVYMRTTCEMLPDVLSYNVIGEVYGSTYPEEIILVGGHLDSWDVGTGAHDDGAGCVQSMDVLHLLKQLDYTPKRTLRCVLFMNEENGLRGGRAYWKASNEAGEYHMAAIESDRGGFTPRGFSADAEDDIFLEKFKNVIEWLPLLEPYGLTFEKGGSGADISGLKSQRGLLFGFMPDTQRYFDYHHTPIDGPDVVNKRELELGAAAMTSLVYLLDKYGIDGQ